MLDTIYHQFEYLLCRENPAKGSEAENGEPLGYAYFFENEYTDRRFIPQALHVLLTYDKPLDGIRVKIVRLIAAIKRIHELDSLGNLPTDIICQLAYDVIAQNYEFIGSVKDYTLYDLYQAQLSELCKQICCDRERVTINY
ncbi:MAG: hypothetical protein IJ934_05565 [Acetobacter sp.]|nr:hypothetical protein [Acetobacter sp.]